jgi:hypothetical protein
MGKCNLDTEIKGYKTNNNRDEIQEKHSRTQFIKPQKKLRYFRIYSRTSQKEIGRV